MDFEELCILLVVGGIAGWIAGLLLSRRSFGLVGNLVVGIIGSFLGRFVLGLLGFQPTSTLADIITAVIGAVLLIWLLAFIPRGKKK